MIGTRDERTASAPAGSDRASTTAAGLRVAFVTPGYPPAVGGLEKHVSRLAHEMSRLGHSVDVLTHRTDDGSPALERQEDVSVRRFALTVGSRTYPVSLSLFRFLLRARNRYDVVHVHNFHSSVAAATLVVARHTPVVFTPHFHGTGHTRLARWLHVGYRPVARAAVSRAARVICVSGAEADAVTDRFAGAANKVVVVHNGVDHSPDAVPYETNSRVVLVVARLEPHKRVDRVVEAMSELPDEFSLVVVGDGSCRARLERLAERLGLGDRARFVGLLVQPDLDRWLATASVLVSMSTDEAFGLTILEAAATGAGVVASDIPAHRDVAALAPDRVTLIDAETTPAKLAETIARSDEIPVWDAALRDELTATVSWRAAAVSTLAVYRSALESP